MSKDMGGGLAILGRCNLPMHLSALENLGEFEVIKVFEDLQPVFPQSPDTTDYSEAINNPEVKGIVLCTPLSESEFWFKEAIRAGKHILCNSPLARTCRQARTIVSRCGQSRARLAVVADVLFSSFGTTIRRILREREIGSLLFFDLRVSLPQKWTENEREGVVLLHGFNYICLILEYFGEIDSIFARSQSLGFNRPVEDVMVAQLRFKDGLEAVFQVNGLGEQEEAIIQLYGSHGSVEFKQNQLKSSEGLEAQYRDFGDVIRFGQAPIFGGDEAVSAHFFHDWIQQSARHNREVLRKDVRIE